MSEIEKLYELAGIKPTKNWQSCLNCKLKTEKFRDEWGEEYLTCINFETPKKCSNAKEFYPLFTAEKQLELIKMLSINYVDKPNKTLWINKDEIANEWFISVHYSDHYGYNNHANNFEEALAGLINQLWQSLTEEEKQQIKEILE